VAAVVLLTRRRFIYTSAAALLGVGVGSGYVETRNIGVTRLNIGLGVKAAFLADPHVHALGDVEERVIELVNSESPDIIMVGGDVVDELTLDMGAAAKYLAGLEAREKFAVMGNHDYWSGKAGELARILKNNKFNLLNNVSTRSSAGKIYGLNWRESRRYPLLKAEGVVLVHDPNAASNISGDCLILAGHTHGGLVIGGLTLYSNSIYARGYYELGDECKLYVSRGLGQMLPLRIASPLELVIID